MSLINLFTTYQLVKSCKNKSKSLFSDLEQLSEEALELNCHYYIALLDTLYSIEDCIENSTDEQGDIDSYADIYYNIQKCSEIEDSLNNFINMNNH